ncbi:hypothetical protein LSH36_6g01086 [Paralvinella palmiformis]|uniref:Uncharacterized protein n=1 Tax=Paralvinella palmiformis TaxID=53620 RepID=A0AAD9KDS0_9ANNE|nr:hypothetical protein LSH36_6g01086 [Paralvinella palmiformis]
MELLKKVEIMCSDVKNGVGVWDTKFALMRSFKLLSRETTCKWLYKVNRLLFIGCTDGLYTCNLTPFTATLAAAVGILKPGSDAIIMAMTQITKNDLTEIKETLHKLADPSQTPKSENFHSVFTSFTDWLSMASSGDLDNISSDINNLINRLANEKTFWPQKAVFQSLLDGHVLQGNHLTLLMPALMDHNETELIHQVLKNVSYIPESVIAQAMSYFTSNTALKLPYNDIFMVQSLRQVEFILIIDLLKYLSWLLSYAPASPQTADVEDIPSLSQLTFFKELGSLDTILRQLKEKWNQKPKHAAKFYCIQTLHIY